MKYIKVMFILYLFIFNNFLKASTLDEVKALKSWIGVPFSEESLIAERDAIISKLQFPVKGEYETTQQFEKRKTDYYNQVNEIKEDYEQKIKDAEALYTAHQEKLKNKLQSLIIQSREVVVMEGKLEHIMPINKPILFKRVSAILKYLFQFIKLKMLKF